MNKISPYPPDNKNIIPTILSSRIPLTHDTKFEIEGSFNYNTLSIWFLCNSRAKFSYSGDILENNMSRDDDTQQHTPPDETSFVCVQLDSKIDEP